MEKMTRAHLETLSTADLVNLADTYGIDIPLGLNRRFIIGELLDLAEENREDGLETAALLDTDFVNTPEVLPDTYNETRLSILLRDPGWLFAYWDFHTNLYTALTGNHRFESFFLRVNTLSDTLPRTITDYFDVDVGTLDRKWYVHLPSRGHMCRVDLYCRNTQEKEQLLVKSQELYIPAASPADITGQTKPRNPPLVELSGIVALRKDHFRNHRQSFD
jgi:hypothetical protein